MYDCHAGRCGKIEDWKCERRCADIESPGKNVIIMSGRYLLVMSSIYQVFLDGCKVYGNTGCWVFKTGVQNWKDFCLKINKPKGNH